MDMKRIEALLELMKKHGLQKLEVEEKGVRYNFEREGAGAAFSTAAPMPPAIMPPMAQAAAPAAHVHAEKAGAHEAGASQIKAPMVGTFYRAAAPDAEPFVEAGDHVTPDTVVCIIEAMKVMNEITADCSGTITKVLLDNNQPVEYGQPLFLVEPD